MGYKPVPNTSVYKLKTNELTAALRRSKNHMTTIFSHMAIPRICGPAWLRLTTARLEVKLGHRAVSVRRGERLAIGCRKEGLRHPFTSPGNSGAASQPPLTSSLHARRSALNSSPTWAALQSFPTRAASWGSGGFQPSGRENRYVVAYCFTIHDESFDLMGSARALQEDLGVTTGFLFDGDVYHASLNRGQGGSSCEVGMGDELMDMFVFEGGTCVFWNTPREYESMALHILQRFRVHEGELVKRDTLRYCHDASCSQVSARQQAPFFLQSARPLLGTRPGAGAGGKSLRRFG